VQYLHDKTIVDVVFGNARIASSGYASMAAVLMGFRCRALLLQGAPSRY
jgi:hypothetical protein